MVRRTGDNLIALSLLQGQYLNDCHDQPIGQVIELVADREVGAVVYLIIRVDNGSASEARLVTLPWCNLCYDEEKRVFVSAVSSSVVLSGKQPPDVVSALMGD